MESLNLEPVTAGIGRALTGSFGAVEDPAVDGLLQSAKLLRNNDARMNMRSMRLIYGNYTS